MRWHRRAAPSWRAQGGFASVAPFERMPGSTAHEDELRAKYLDWCSARLADRFLALSPDEIYELAERASHGRMDTLVASGASRTRTHPISDDPQPSAASSDWREPENFRLLVARVTEVLAETLPLPTFEDWAAAYRDDPKRFDVELLGFWKDL